MIVNDLPDGASHGSPVLVVGAGPAGLVQALELRRHGIEVTVLAGGMDGFRADFQALADAEIADPRHHAPMAMAVRRALGGTSLLWGGRCVAFDDIDFTVRDHVPFSGWPFGPETVRPWYEIAARYLDCGPPIFEEPLGAHDGNAECRLDRLERWSETANLRQLHAKALADDPGLRICLGAVATDLDIDPANGHVRSVAVTLASRRQVDLRVRTVVLACGGLETARLLLATQMTCPQAFGGEAGPLGRFYMGHLEGRLADIVFLETSLDGAFNFHLGEARRYVRRRLTVTNDAQQRHGLLNFAAWPDHPLLGRPEHRSAILSLAYLSLAAPGLGGLLAPEAIRRKHLNDGVDALGQHLGNIVKGLPDAVRESARYLYGRYIATPRLPGFFVLNKAHRYAFFYHAEQAPNPDSRVRLSSKRDPLGMPRLHIDLRYGNIDAHSVVENHRVIDNFLRRANLARLDYAVPESQREASVLAQATDGYHQIGTTRMDADPSCGVVDADCRVHGTPNLFIASSSVFPTSGQANPTLLTAALSARLAAHIAANLTHRPQSA